MFCPHCGTSLKEGSRFCPECGTRITAAPPAGGQSPNDPWARAGQQPPAQQPAAQQGFEGGQGYGQQDFGGYGQPFEEQGYAQQGFGGGQGYNEPQAYSQQEYRQPPQPSPTSAQPSAQVVSGALKTDRDIITYALLTIVTCGIYGYWYIYHMAQDTNVLCADDGQETTGLGIYILLSIVTCGIYSYYWQYKLADRLKANAYRYGVTIEKGGSDVLLWLILGAVVSAVFGFTVILAFAGMAVSCIGTNMIFQSMNTLCSAYNHINGYEQ